MKLWAKPRNTQSHKANQVKQYIIGSDNINKKQNNSNIVFRTGSGVSVLGAKYHVIINRSVA